MKRIELNVQTEELLISDFSPEEELAAETERSSPEVAKHISELSEISSIKTDLKFQNLIKKTPAQVKNWVENSFPSLTLSEQHDLAIVVTAVGILGRRL